MSADKNNEEFSPGFGEDFAFASSTQTEIEIEEERPPETPFQFDEEPMDGGFAGQGTSWAAPGHSAAPAGLFEHEFEDEEDQASRYEDPDPEPVQPSEPDVTKTVFAGFDAPVPRMGSAPASANIFGNEEEEPASEGPYEDEVHTATPPVERRSGLPSYLKYGALAAGMVVVAGVATVVDWTSLLGGGQEYQVAAPATLDDGLENLRPVDGKAWETGQSAPALPPVSTTQPVMPKLPSEASAIPVKADGDLALAIEPNKGALAPFPGLAPLGDETPRLDTIPAMPAAVPVQTGVSNEEVAALRREIDDLRTRLASLEERPSTPSPVVEPPAKPEVVDGWSLKGVFGETAWLNQKGQAGEPREVTIGDTVDGLGRVKDITRYEGNWIVVTDLGVVVRD